MKRTTLIKNYINDDISYTITLFYAICLELNTTFKDLILKFNLSKKDIKSFLDIAEVEHCLPFKQSIEESICFLLKIDRHYNKNIFSYSKLNDKIGQIKRFVNSICMEYNLNEYDVIYTVFKYGLADRMVDSNDATSYTQSNIILYEYKDEIINNIDK